MVLRTPLQGLSALCLLTQDREQVRVSHAGHLYFEGAPHAQGGGAGGGAGSSSAESADPTMDGIMVW